MPGGFFNIIPSSPLLQNPLAYGIPWEEVSADHALEGRRRKLITDAARELERSKMARFDERSGNLYVTGGGAVLGRGDGGLSPGGAVQGGSRRVAAC